VDVIKFFAGSNLAEMNAERQLAQLQSLEENVPLIGGMTIIGLGIFLGITIANRNKIHHIEAVFEHAGAIKTDFNSNMLAVKYHLADFAKIATSMISTFPENNKVGKVCKKILTEYITEFQASFQLIDSIEAEVLEESDCYSLIVQLEQFCYALLVILNRFEIFTITNQTYSKIENRIVAHYTKRPDFDISKTVNPLKLNFYEYSVNNFYPIWNYLVEEFYRTCNIPKDKEKWTITLLE
jgi:hypothetical protein